MDVDFFITRLFGGNSKTIGADASHTYYADAPVQPATATVDTIKWKLTRISLDLTTTAELPGTHDMPVPVAAVHTLSGFVADVEGATNALYIIAQDAAGSVGIYIAVTGEADTPGLEWGGKGAAKIGLEGKAEGTDFKKVLQGTHPAFKDGDKTPAGADTKHRAGWDLTFSAPKSVSLAILVGGDRRLDRALHRRLVGLGLKAVVSRAVVFDREPIPGHYPWGPRSEGSAFSTRLPWGRPKVGPKGGLALRAGPRSSSARPLVIPAKAGTRALAPQNHCFLGDFSMKKPATDSTTPVMKAVIRLPPGWNQRVRTTSRTSQRQRLQWRSQ
jgi:hypothetical protein